MRRCKRLVPPLVALAGLLPGAYGTYGPPSERVQNVLKSMTLDDKIGQMGQLDIYLIMNYDGGNIVDKEKARHYIRNFRLGSFLNSPQAGDNGKQPWTPQEWRAAMLAIQEVAEEEGVLPLIHGLDSVHGANYVKGATIFPHQFAVAATFNSDYASAMGRVTAQDTMAAGIQWAFGPILDLGVNPRWPRMYETFSEDPFLTAVMGAHVIEGMQNYSVNGLRFASCMKHFISYSASVTGQDQSPVWLDKRDVLNYYLTPYRAAVKAGAATAMEAYIEISGVPVVSSREYLIDVLRNELGFRGMLVTDYGEIEALHGEHAVAASDVDAVRIAMDDTSIDMSMVAGDTEFMQSLKALVEAGQVPVERLDESVTRVLQLKEWTGILDHPKALLAAESELDRTVGSPEDKALALDAAREAITLLQNNNTVLPLGDRQLDILVVGPTADSLAYQCGGWTVHWHGPLNSEEVWYGASLYNSIKAEAPAGSTVDYSQGVNIAGKWVMDKQQLIDRATSADVIIVGIGEQNYAEAEGNIEDLALEDGQIELVAAVASTGKPVVVVLIEGRPRLLGSVPQYAEAVIHGYLPGPDGGKAIAEVIFGKVNPSGRLPFTYPRHQNTPIQYYHKIRQRDYDVQWPFGQGLSYTSFEYTDLSVQPSTIDENTVATVSVSVKNTGRVAGKHAVLMFISDVIRRVTPEVKMLKGFSKVELAPGESTTVQLQIDPREHLAFYGVDRRRTLEAGDFLIGVGHEVDCRTETGRCASLTLRPTTSFSSVCEDACKAWAEIHGRCKRQLGTSSFATRAACQTMCSKQKDWGRTYVECLEMEAASHSCAVNTMCRNVFAH